jgi:hypothetical protein
MESLLSLWTAAVFLPARITLRALDDLHALAEATRRVDGNAVAEASRRADALEERLDALIVAQSAAVQTQARLAELEAQLVHNVALLTTTVEPLRDAAQQVGRVTDRLPGRMFRGRTS